MSGLDRVYITGAPGSGVTTLGRAVAARLGAVHIDTDDHYWAATDPPYQVKRDVADRLSSIAVEQARTGRWVVSGTLETWGEKAIADAQLVVFLEAPTPVRLERLRARERARFGDSLGPGGAMHETHRHFIEWASHYEDGTQPGRSRPRHERWLANTDKPILRLDGTRRLEDLVDAVCRAGSPSAEPGSR